MDIEKLVAIDVHVHAEVSCHQPEDPIMGKYFDASTAYFKADRQRPTIPETIELYRAQNMALTNSRIGRWLRKFNVSGNRPRSGISPCN